MSSLDVVRSLALELLVAAPHSATAVGSSTATTTTRMLSGEDSSLTHASFAKIIGTGVLLGIVHVLTGPDHLSALAAMTTSSSWKAFSIGIRWGCGHSIGLIIMALVFFAAGRSFDLDDVGVYCNYIVGVFMVALGGWTAIHVKRKYRSQLKETQLIQQVQQQQRSSRHSLHTTTQQAAQQQQQQSLLERVASTSSNCNNSQRNNRTSTGSSLSIEPEPPVENAAASAVDTTLRSSSPVSSFQLLTMDDCTDDKSIRDTIDLEQQEKQTPATTKRCCCCHVNTSFSNPATQRFTALLVGIVHGIAGPGGVLGVLPAVVMDDWSKSVTYLASFCVASIFIMGVFAALYGEITGRLSRNSHMIELRIGLFSAAFSVVVGVAWIVLQATGQMDKVFE